MSRHAWSARNKTTRPHADSETVPVVVYAGQKQRVGLVVGSILDIVEEALVVRAPSQQPGVLFTAVIQGRVTEFLDVEALLRLSDPHFIEQPDDVPVEAAT